MVESLQSLTGMGLNVYTSVNENYNLIDKMGEGNASVFVVSHKIYKEWGECALKSLPFGDRSIKEVKLQKSLRHSNIVTTYDCFIAEDRQKRKNVYVVMEMAESKLSLAYLTFTGDFKYLITE